MIFFLLLVTATFRPAAPTVGDPITIQFEQPVTLDPSDAYEVLSHDGATVVVRSFRPEPFDIAGQMGNIRFRKLTIPMTSVLQPDDEMKPAPLKPPVESERSRRPMIAMGSAAAAAAIAWLAALLLARRAMRPPVVIPQVSAADAFRQSVAALRMNPGRADRWADLADATRRYLAATNPTLALELTTAEFLAVTRERRDVVEMILRQGDLEKFSPWGAQADDFDLVARRALELAT